MGASHDRRQRITAVYDDEVLTLALEGKDCLPRFGRQRVRGIALVERTKSRHCREGYAPCEEHFSFPRNAQETPACGYSKTRTSMSAAVSPKTLRRAEKLRKELHEHDYKYYVLARPTISD